MLKQGLDECRPGLLSIRIRDLLLKEINVDMEYIYSKIGVFVERVREELSIYPMSRNESFTRVAAADAGSQILPLAAKRYGVASALVYILPENKRYWLPPELVSLPYTLAGERFKGVLNVRREAKLYETAIFFLESFPDVELLFVDGPLVFSSWWNLSGGKKDQKRLVNAANRLLRLCRSNGTIIAGVVKRGSARHLSRYLGLESDLPDSFLLHQALKVGERTDVFSPSSVFVDGYRSFFLSAIEEPIYSFYGRMARDWSIPPVRVDLPVFCLSRIDDIADYCYASSISNGIPFPLMKADEEVRVTRRFVAEIYSEALRKIGRNSGDVKSLVPAWGESKWMGV